MTRILFTEITCYMYTSGNPIAYEFGAIGQ